MKMLNYNKFINYIKEGLIKTHNILKYSHTLEQNLHSIGYDINLDVVNKFEFNVTIFNPIHFMKSKDIYDLFFSYINNMGYFPTSFKVFRENRTNFFQFNFKLFQQQIKNCDKLIIYFECKYEDGLYKNTLIVPEKAYHLSPIENRDNISNNGFYAKSSNRKTYHPDRIYMFYNLEDYKELLKSLKSNDLYKFNKQRKYDLYEITLNDNIIIHSDPKYDKGFFIYDNIHPKDKIILYKDL